MGELVTIYDPECGEDRYCTPEFRDSAVAIFGVSGTRTRAGCASRQGVESGADEFPLIP